MAEVPIKYTKFRLGYRFHFKMYSIERKFEIFHRRKEV